MNITVFAKKRTTREGKSFYSYLTTLHRKSDLEDVTVAVKFRESCGSPKPEECPMNLIVDKKNANLQERKFERDNGDVGYSLTLWVSDWAKGEPYEDNSLDDYE